MLHLSANNHRNHAAFLAAQNPSPLLEEVRALPCWPKFPYRSVEVSLPDGSSFRLRAPDLAFKAIGFISPPGAEPMHHLVEQVIPLVQESPEFLLEIASRLSWPEARALACEAFWRSPCAILARPFKQQARMSLRA